MNEQQQPMDLGDLTPVNVPVKIGGRSYILTEASADAVKRYRFLSMKGIQRSEDGRISGLAGSAEAEPLLVSLCLFCADSSDPPKPDFSKPVPLPLVLQWPNRVVGPLFDRVKEISGLNTDDKPDAIRRQIETLQRRLVELEGREGDPKNSSSGGEAS